MLQSIGRFFKKIFTFKKGNMPENGPLTNVTHQPKPTSHWRELAERLQLEAQVEQYLIQEQREKERISEEIIHMWKENNRMLDDLRQRQAVRRPHLHVVNL